VVSAGGLSVGLPNGSRIKSIATGTLSAGPTDTPIIIPAHIFSDSDLDRTLIALADYTIAGCTITLTDTDSSVARQNTNHARH
jgi:hypothetical protein